MKKEEIEKLAVKLKETAFTNELRNNDVIDYDELEMEFEKAIKYYLKTLPN